MKTLVAEDIAELLHKDTRTVMNDLRRRPNTLPPKLMIPGSRKPIWLEEDVHQWIKNCRKPATKKTAKLA
jgi:predicted DNA-binding transcriptional regulator AlpA